ncbi:Kinesin-related protein-like [Zostera marina]|uniref:Kinesin-related protein-like n=1 Tax=Zostera marina TaxID=29655 RepID=A0A0K9P1M1_ZOSMR|nr:Kinesin-related protein-like [Zostera marina]
MSFTPRRKLGFSVPSTPSGYTTPRPEKRPFDLRWADGSSYSTSNVRDGEVNVKVIVRCRPFNDEELKNNVQSVVLCNELNGEVRILQSIVNKQLDKLFPFDKVFSSKTQQRRVYDDAISPIVSDVLEGFNCTVFAYGQTGTGKTYTMEGGMESVKGGELSSEAGVIPRAVRQIFDTLDEQKADYSMKVSFLELYNEEITDLLVFNDSSRNAEEEKQRKPICLLEDGKGGAIIRGLEEEVVKSASEIFSLLERATPKRRTADTLLNTQSSRSHSVFSIMIHVKEPVMGDEELIKYGRLNLVDLAGSENVSRSGSREGRAREAGEVNKSLLTLGRVITALVEHSCHIPFRDSKLTRLLRESLGGKTKTCIIATISPSIHSLEETLNTLDYAFRAKSIRNKPEVNQKLSKSVLLKDMYQEMERLKQDLKAAREKNGVYIPSDRFAQDEAEKKVMIEKVEQLEFDLNFTRKQAELTGSYKEQYSVEKERNMDLEKEIKICKMNMEALNVAFLDIEEKLKESNLTLKEKEFIISNLLTSENAIIEKAKDLHSNLEIASNDISKLHAKMDQKTKIEAQNNAVVMNYGAQLDQSLKKLHQCVIGCVTEQHQILQSMEEEAKSFIAKKCEETTNMESKIQTIKDQYYMGIGTMNDLACTLRNKGSLDIEELKSANAILTMTVENFMLTMVSEAEQVLNYIQSSLVNQKQIMSLSSKQQEEGLQRTLLSTQMISRTTVDFFNELHIRASNLFASIGENEIERNKEFSLFKKKFQEVSAREEKSTLEKIACILLTADTKNNEFVSEALDAMFHDTFLSGKKTLQDLSEIQKMSSKAENDWKKYIEKTDSQIRKDAKSVVEIRDVMENSVLDCSGYVNHSKRQWNNIQSTINSLNKVGNEAMDAILEEGNLANCKFLDEFASVCLSTDAKINNGTSDLLWNINNALLLDHEMEKEIQPMNQKCVDQLKLFQESHLTRITNSRDLAEKHLLREYKVDKVDCQTCSVAPKKQQMNIPSMASIEALRTPTFDNLLKDMRSLKGAEAKQPETPRSPLKTVN